MANPMPVFPEVASTIVVRPGAISPRFSACSTIALAIRSFTESPGLANSSLARTRAALQSGPGTRWSATSGVLPINSVTSVAMAFECTSSEGCRCCDCPCRSQAALWMTSCSTLRDARSEEPSRRTACARLHTARIILKVVVALTKFTSISYAAFGSGRMREGMQHKITAPGASSNAEPCIKLGREHHNGLSATSLVVSVPCRRSLRNDGVVHAMRRS
mmetsp:Transcript_43549/g.95292  ORF Transcript_43549/g.95292 Transcript_43549/m.95292 type:complete len:218 (+) Transcript_43549:1180-1833(+)